MNTTNAGERKLTGAQLKAVLDKAGIPMNAPFVYSACRAIESELANAAPAGAVPEGWKLVPMDITEDMHAAAVRAVIRSTGNDDCPPNVWSAMLAAAPVPPVAAPADPILATWPARIWLQWNPDEREEYPGASEDLTWCADHIHKSDVGYVRADLAAPSEQALQQPIIMGIDYSKDYLAEVRDQARRYEIEAVPVVRDDHGFWSHPAIPNFDENHKSFNAWVRAVGLEVTYKMLESEDDQHPVYISYFENEEPSFAAWAPSPPEGDGWFTFSIHDTEDGPVWVWARRIIGSLRTSGATGEKGGAHA